MSDLKGEGGPRPSVERLDWRLSALEQRVNTSLRELNESVKALGADVRNLAFVRNDVYLAHREAQDERIESATKTAASALRMSMTILGLFCTVVVGAILTVLVKLVAG